MTDEQREKALAVLRASRERSAALRARGTVGVKPTTIDDEKSDSAMRGTLASIGVGAKESAKNAIFNAKSMVKTDALSGKATGLETATKAVSGGIDYDSFMDDMRKKYGKAQTFWAIKMSPEERDIYASVIQRKKLGLDSAGELEREKAAVQGKLDSIEQERLDRSLRSQAALRAVDDKYELGKVGEFAQEVGGAFGQMLPSMAVGVINPAAGVASFGVQAGLQGYGQARDEGASHEDAVRYGVATGVMEAGIEKATGGMGKVFGKGYLDKAIKMQPSLSKRAVLANTARGAVGEGAEEAASGFLDPYLQRATYDPDAENATAGELAYQAAIGAALGGILGGGSNALDYRSSKKAQQRAEAEAKKREQDSNTLSFRDVDYADKAQQTAIMQDVNREMVQDGRVVVADSNMLKELEEYYPDLRSMKSKDRKPILKAKMNALKEKLKKDLTALKDTKFEFNVNDGVLEAKLYDTGIKEVLEKITKQKAAMISSSEDIFKNAKYMYSTQDYEGNPNIERWNYFYTPVKIGDDVVGVRIAVRDMYTPKESQIYNWGIKKEATLDGAGRLPNGSIPSGVSSVATSTIPQQESTVNAYAKAYEQMVSKDSSAENRSKEREFSEDEKKVKRFIQTATINSRLDVKYKDMPLNQKAYYKDGTIYINQNRPLNEGMKSTVAHEIFHSLEGSKEHDRIVELALQSVGDGAIQRKIDSYGKYGIALDEAGAKAEIGAEYIEKALTDEATINQILLENKSLAGRILERIKDMIAFYKAKKSMTAEEAREYKALLKAKYLYEDGLAKLNSGEYEPYSGERNARYRLLGINADGVEVYETPEDIKKLPYAERKEKFLDLMRKEYRGRTAKFKVGNNVYYARFEDADLKKNVYGDRLSSANGWKAKINAGASGDIFDLVENAKYDGSKADVGKTAKAHKEVTDWDYFVKQVQIDNKVYDLLANVRKKSDGKYIYSIQLKDNKKIRVSPPVAITKNNSVKMGDQHSTNNISDTSENVNTQNERFSIDEQTDTPQFKEWFGNSKVVDSEGKPKVVYSGHGNTNLFGSKFDVKKATSGGFYFTEDPDIASSYAKDKLGNLERYENGSEYRFKNSKGEYKDTIDKVRLNEEQVKVFDKWFDEDMGYTFEDYVRENAPYDESVRGLNYNGGKYNLQNIYKLMESLGYVDNGWDYRTQQKKNSTFEDLLDEMGIVWDSYTKPSGGVFPVYLSIKNPIDTSKEFPQDLMNELEYAASKERKSEGEHWTKDYPLKKWVEDIKNDDGNSGWATQVPTKARKIMLEMGYDGIKDTGGKQGGAEHTVWVALEPTQVKSAIGNRGTFDAKKADIRYSIDEDTSASQGSGTSGEKVGYRFFDNTFQNTPIFDDAVKEVERSYEHERSRVSEKENIAEARQRLRDNGWYKEINTVLKKNSVDGADTDVAMAIISQLNNYEPDSAEFERIMKFAEDYADKTVESGQFIQSLAKYTRTPVGKTEKAMRDIKREEKELQKSNPKKWNDTEKKAAGAKRAYSEAQEEAANEAVEKAVTEVADSVDMGSAEKILNEVSKRKRKSDGKKKQDNAQDDLAEELAAKIKSYITPKSDTVDNARLQRDIINELFKLAKESPLPDKAINVQKKDYVKILREILHNQEKYEGVWQDAREFLAKKYKNNPEKMAVLEDYFNNYIVPVYSESSMREALRGVMEEIGLDTRGFSASDKKSSGADKKKALRDILLESKDDKANAREEIRQILADRLGLGELDKQTVDVVTNNILSTYDKVLKAKAEKKLNKFLDDEIREQAKRESLKKQMLRMVRNGTFSDDEATRVMRKAYDVPTLTTEEVRTILNYYEKADEFAEGSYDRRKWESRAQKIIADKTPKTFSEKNKTLRRIAMMTNPATWQRNIFGNVIFSAAEAVKNVPAGLIDKKIAQYTGKRTTSANVIADLEAYKKGFARGYNEWKADIEYGVDTSHSAVREEYQGSGNTFNDAHWPGKIANKAELVMSKALQIGDRPFYEAAYDQRISELKRLGYDTSQENIQAEAKIYALERVYQNDSKISTALTKVRNELGIFGHFLIPFTQTPGNLLDKCIDYSGAGGIARAIYQIGVAKKTGNFDQKLFVDRLGRALTGLGIMAFGAFLESIGCLVGTDEDDYELMGAKRLAGEKEYSLRIGDTYYTIDWAQPVSAILIAGAEAHKAGMEQDDWMQIAIATGEGVINTLFAMSCLEGLESMMASYGNAEPADKIADVMISGVSQYFPTALRRLNNVIDPIQRQTYSANPIIKQAKYMASGIPGVSYLLEPKYTLEGDAQYKSQGRGIVSRTAENFLSPANIGRRYHSKVNDELLRIYEETGKTNQFLHYAKKNLDYGKGGKYVLSPEDYNRMQKEIGTNTTKAMSALMNSSVYKSMSDTEKAEALSDVAKFYDDKFKDEYAKANRIVYDDKSYQSSKAKIDKYGWAGYFEIKRDFKKEDGSSMNFEVAEKRKEFCDKYGIKYDSYNSTVTKVDAIKEKNKNRYTKVSDKAEANKRDMAKYLSTLDLTDPQRQVLWKEIGGYDGKNSETYKSVARRYGF